MPKPTSALDADQPCLRCRYNLRSLTVDSRCPECGLSVERTLRGRYLRYSAPGHIKSLLLGVGLVMLSLHVVLPSAVALFFLYVAAPSYQEAPLWAFLCSFLLLVAISLAPGFYLTGWWLLLRRDPECADVKRLLFTRRLARIVTVLLAVAWAGASLLLVLDHTDVRPIESYLDKGVLVAAAGLLVLHGSVGALHLQSLVGQAEGRPQRLALVMVWLFGATMLAGLVLFLLGSRLAPLFGLLAAVGVCISVALGVAVLGDLESTVSILRTRSLDEERGD
jgi:hypothetical protein